MRVTTLVAVGDDVELTGDSDARYPIYSVTKTAVAAAVLLLVREGAIDLDSVRRLLDHTSGVRDYGSLPEYHEAVRTRPRSAWDDDEFLARTAAAGPSFEPGEGWAYSNTGYLLLRRLLDDYGGLAAFLPRLGLVDTTVAERAEDLDIAAPAPSALLLDGVDDVRGVYDPRWVGHRTLVARAGDLLGFWRDLPAEMLDPRTFVRIGFDAPGFVRPSYGLGVMADPEHPLGTVVGHGGGGPGYATAVFAVPEAGTVAIVLAADERYPAQQKALELLTRLTA
ncbi:MAG: serine hydrolase [Gaiellaceae bacterium]